MMTDQSTGTDDTIAVFADVAAHRVSVKAPPFMETAVQGWFAILDAQFQLARITASDTKFYHVLSSLPPDTIAHVSPDVLASKNFDKLQEAVTDMYEKAKPELFERLISKARLTGRPSLFLSELRKIAEKVGVGDELIRHKFLQSLPTGIAAALASQREMSLSQLGKLADELLPLIHGAPQAAYAVVGECESQPPPGAYQPLPGAYQPPVSQHQLAQCHLVSPPRQPQFDHPHQPSAGSRGAPAGAPGTPLGLTPYHAGQRQQVCRSHLFYGARARTCKPWCQWPSKASDLKVQPSSRPASPARALSSQEN